MGKRKSHVKESRKPKRRVADDDTASEDMDDEIDAFHRQRDVIPLDINGDAPDSDEDNEHPVFNLEGVDDDDDDGDNEDIHDTGFAAQIARQQKFLRAKFGGVEDEMHEDEEEDIEEQKTVWGGRKGKYYDADNRDFEIQSSDDESLAEEEDEVIRLQKEKAKTLSLEDFGLEDINQDESDRELTLEEMSAKKLGVKTSSGQEAQDDTDTTYQKIAKDLNALTREEQMDVLYSSAPELIGLLSELNEAVDLLECKVNPALSKVQNAKVAVGGLQYLELKQLVLVSYCQAISFYLLLKAEGQPVRDHPVISRLVEIKSLLDKVKQLDEKIPSDWEQIMNVHHQDETTGKLGEESTAIPEFLAKDRERVHSSGDLEVELLSANARFENVDKLKDNGKKAGKHKQVANQMDSRSMAMLKVRARLEEKLKRKDFTLIQPTQDGGKNNLQPINRKLETYDDFNDDTFDNQDARRGQDEHASTSNLSRLVVAKLNKPKVISGDDDLPKRDDFGERRKKYDLQMMARAGNKPNNDSSDLEADANGVIEGNGDMEDSEDEFYKQVKQQRAAKLAAKAATYSKTPEIPSSPETVDGKRKISYQMAKNRGLTRHRKKLTKNPRKKYKLKFKDAANRRKGQVREIRTPVHSYGGEATGINPGISRSIRFKS